MPGAWAQSYGTPYRTKYAAGYAIVYGASKKLAGAARRQTSARAGCEAWEARGAVQSVPDRSFLAPIRACCAHIVISLLHVSIEPRREAARMLRIVWQGSCQIRI